MRVNLPVAGRERAVPKDEELISAIDLRITAHRFSFREGS